MNKIDMRNLPPEVAAYIRSLEKKNAQLEQENKKLQGLAEQLVKMRKRMFGQSSEQAQYVNGEQLDFFNEAEAAADACAEEPGKDIPVKAHQRKPKSTKADLTKGLEHKKVVLDLPDDQQICDICGSPRVKIGEKFIRSELVIVPAQMYVLDYYAASYKCAACEKETGETEIFQAEAPVPVMKKSMAAPATVAYVIQEKFQNGVPLYRQEEYWKSKGVQLHRNTMANWVIRSSRWFVPLWDLLRKELLSGDIVNADETTCQVLKEDGRDAKKKSQMWVFCSPEKKIALYKYAPSRGGKVAREMLEGFSGYLQTDGYSGYNSVEDATRVGCWAHARRKWVDCFPDGVPVENTDSKQAFELVEKLFCAEKELKLQDPANWKKHRRERLEPILNEYWELLESFEAENGTNLQKAQTYSLNQKQSLNAVLENCELELTNNLAERTVKPFVMARKNFLFADTPKGADASALCFSILETAKRNELDPFGYLLYLLQELPKLGEEPTEEQLLPLLPWSATLPDYCKKRN